MERGEGPGGETPAITANDQPPARAPGRRGLAAKLARPTTATRPVIPARSFAEAPLSAAQRRIWFFHEIDVSGAAMDVVLAKLLTSPLDRMALETAMAELVARHEPLRTVLVEHDSGEPTQRLSDEAVEPVYLDLGAHLGRDADDEELRGAAATLLPGGLKLGEPLFRWGLVRAADDRHALVVSVHHIAFDGTSVGLFWSEVGARYAAATRRSIPELPELQRGYLDYAAWSRAEGSSDRDAGFWARTLEGATTPTELPSDRVRQGTAAHRGGKVRGRIDAGLAERLRRLARDRRMTLFMVLESAFSILVSRWTGSSDVVIGTPVAGRGAPGTENLLGCFINMIPLRARIDPWGSVDETLGEIRSRCMDAFAHQNRPFEDIVRDAGPVRVAGRHPLFDLVFVLNQSPPEMRLPGLTVIDLPLAASTSQMDLTFSVYEQGGCSGLDIVLEYDSDLFDESSMTRFVAQWTRLLTQLVEDPRTLVRDLELMAPDERDRLLDGGDRTADEAAFVPLAALLADAAVGHAGRVAVELGGERLTYGELGRLAAHLADQFGAYDIQRGDVVAVALERSLELIVAQVAVVAYGAVLLPIEVDQPPRRVDEMLRDARARLVLASDAGAVGRANLLPVLDVVAVLASAPRGGRDIVPRVAHLEPEDGAYTLFTSGSTGRPKGAVNTQAAIANRIEWMQQTYRLTPADRVLHKTPIAFDVAVWEWLWPLTVGATVVLAEPGAHKDPVALARCITDHEVTVTHCIPSMLRLFAAQPEAMACRSLRQIVCSGEELTAVGVEEALRICPSVDNLYGPTEAAIDVTWWACRGDEDRVPIGSAISGVRCRVVDETGALVPVGVPGELLIGGVALAQGYAFRPGLTARAFVPDPWGDGDRLYRTGDRVRWREPGVLEFLGRLDAQVKIRGVRVEPGEVEAALGAHHGVVEAAVIVRTDAHRGAHLAAFVSGTADPAELRTLLRRRLPEAMVPSVIEKVVTMPRTTSGKIDRSGLASTPLAPAAIGDGSERPGTEVQRRIAGMWSSVLGVPEPGLDDNFFDLGGHSLIITRLSALVREAFGVKVEVRRFLKTPTVRGMADGVVESQLRQGDPDVVLALLDLLEERGSGAEEARARVALPEQGHPGTGPSRPVGPGDAPPSLASIALPTYERMSALLRALRSYQDNAKRYGRSPTFTVMDNSRARTTRDDYRQALGGFAHRSGAEISYAGVEEKTAWLDACAQESGVPRRVIAFALFGHSRGPYNAANNANANILHATGRPVLCADDDTLADLRLPPGHSDRVVFGFGNPEINWAFDDLADLDATMVATDADVLGTYGALLGRSPAQIVAGSPEPHREGADDRGRVALVVPSLTGDCGWASPSSYLHLTGPSLDRLTVTEDAYTRARTSRINARFVDQTTVVRRLPGFMCTFYGLDTSTLVLPYVPCTMGNDTLYPLLHGICFPEDAYAFSPLALRHEPVDTRRFWSGEVVRGASGIDFSYLVAGLVEPLWSQSARDPAPTRTRAERVRALGRFLVELGEASPGDFWSVAEDRGRARAEAELQHQHATLAAHPAGAEAWRRDLSAYLHLRERAMRDDDFAVPLDLSMGEGADSARELALEFVLAFGELLVAWPDIVAAADTLNGRERPLARSVRPGAS